MRNAASHSPTVFSFLPGTKVDPRGSMNGPHAHDGAIVEMELVSPRAERDLLDLVAGDGSLEIAAPAVMRVSC